MSQGVEEAVTVATAPQEVFVPEFGLLSARHIQIGKTYEGRIYRLNPEAAKVVAEQVSFVANFELSCVHQAYVDLYSDEGMVVFEIEKNARPPELALRFMKDRWLPTDASQKSADPASPWTRFELKATQMPDAVKAACGEQLKILEGDGGKFFVRVNWKDKTYSLITETTSHAVFPAGSFSTFTLPTSGADAVVVSPEPPQTEQKQDLPSVPVVVPEFSAPEASSSPFGQVRPVVKEAEPQPEPVMQAAEPPSAEAQSVEASAVQSQPVVETPVAEAQSAEASAVESQPVVETPAAEPQLAETQPVQSQPAEPPSDKSQQVESPAVPSQSVEAPAADSTTIDPPSPTQEKPQEADASGKEKAERADKSGDSFWTKTKNRPNPPKQEEPPAAPVEAEPDESSDKKESQSTARRVLPTARDNALKAGLIQEGKKKNRQEYQSQEPRREYSSDAGQAKYATYSRSEVDQLLKQQTEEITNALGNKISSAQRSFTDAVEKQEKTFTKLVDSVSTNVEGARQRLEATVNKAQDATHSEIETFHKELAKELEQHRTQINKSVLPVAKFLEGDKQPPKQEKKEKERDRDSHSKSNNANNQMLMNLLYVNVAISIGVIVFMMVVLMPLGQRIEKIELEMTKSAEASAAAKQPSSSPSDQSPSATESK